jgi:hypothetical protein
VDGLGGEVLATDAIVQYESRPGRIYESRRVTDQNTLIWSLRGRI